MIMKEKGGVDRWRNPKGATRAFLEEYLRSNPGKTGPEIVAAGASLQLKPSSIYRDLKTWRRIRPANGRYWLDKIGDPEPAVEAEVKRAFEIVKSPYIPEATKIDVLAQLSRSAGRAPPAMDAVVDLIGLPKLSRRVQRAMLPFVHIAIRAAFQSQESRSATSSIPRARYTARLLESALRVLGPFLDDPGDEGTIAWNTVYAIVTSLRVPDDFDLMGIANHAIEIELKGKLPSPSATRSLVRKLAEDEHVGPEIERELMRRLPKSRGVSRERIQSLLETLDVGHPAGQDRPTRHSKFSPGS